MPSHWLRCPSLTQHSLQDLCLCRDCVVDVCLGGTLAGQVQLAKVGETGNNKLTNSTWEGMAVECANSVSNDHHSRLQGKHACYFKQTAQAACFAWTQGNNSTTKFVTIMLQPCLPALDL